MNTWKSISKLKIMAGIPESTLRRYVKRFGEYFPAKKFGNTMKYSVDCVDIFLDINNRYASGDSTNDIVAWLKESYPVCGASQPESTHSSPKEEADTKPENEDIPLLEHTPIQMVKRLAAALETLSDTQQTIDDVKVRMNRLDEENAHLRERVQSLEFRFGLGDAELDTRLKRLERKHPDPDTDEITSTGKDSNDKTQTVINAPKETFHKEDEVEHAPLPRDHMPGQQTENPQTASSQAVPGSELWNAQVRNIILTQHHAGCSPREIASQLTEAGVLTERGKTKWHHQVVRRRIKKYEADT